MIKFLVGLLLGTLLGGATVKATYYDLNDIYDRIERAENTLRTHITDSGTDIIVNDTENFLVQTEKHARIIELLTEK